jgi:hypothetical protein
MRHRSSTSSGFSHAPHDNSRLDGTKEFEWMPNAYVEPCVLSFRGDRGGQLTSALSVSARQQARGNSAAANGRRRAAFRASGGRKPGALFDSKTRGMAPSDPTLVTSEAKRNDISTYRVSCNHGGQPFRSGVHSRGTGGFMAHGEFAYAASPYELSRNARLKSVYHDARPAFREHYKHDAAASKRPAFMPSSGAQLLPSTLRRNPALHSQRAGHVCLHQCSLYRKPN